MKTRTGALALEIAHDISSQIASGSIEVGAHLSTQQLADKFGVSRSPVRQALVLLAERGLLEQRANRGFFANELSVSAKSELVGEIAQAAVHPNHYHQLADDWLHDRIPAEVTEQFIRERYELTKSQLNDVLVRAVREGWAERKQGYGWRFLPVAKTPEAFEQIYRFRILIEPAGMLEPGFRIDHDVLNELRREQEHVLASDIDSLPAEYLLDCGARFHEELMRMSGNPFFHMSLIRVNRMRRLLEYRATLNRKRFVGQCEEHLEIIHILEKGDVTEASFLMRRHLGGALSSKSPVAWQNSTGEDSVGSEELLSIER
ncbi:GntR family transcriptional regulator [Granulosicoccus sp. 3-233]|uniref:GntR family transcriptional regulator n=1 Tax=Granulosicoccus sp. 3-233 TaxID=3417969 RepID=UPI003D33DEC0